MKKIFEKEKDGFSIVLKSEGWQMAIVTYAEQYDVKNYTKMARHMTTDEVFALIEGDATLCTINGNDNIEKIPLEKSKIYCIEKGTWHSLILSEDAVLVVTENKDVKSEDTEKKVLL